MNRKPAIGIGIAVAIAALGLAAWASDSARTEKPAAVDAQEYADFMAHEALDVQDLAEGAEIQRRLFNRMTPPGLSWVQTVFPLTVPFDAVNFDEKFLNELLGEDRNSVAVYPLTLALDPKTRETLIFNAEGKPIAALPAEKTFRAWSEGSDPARVVLRLDLLPAEDMEPYLYVEDRIADSLAAVAEKAAKPARKEAVAKSSLSGGQFGFADAQKLTNGNFRLAVTNGPAAAEIFSYTIWHTSSVVVSTWTNDLDEVVVSTNVVWTPVSPPYAGLERAWDVETTNLILTNGVGDWEDASTAGSARVRFYGAAQSADSDEDGLTDGAEIFLHRTDPALTDTDGDGMPDGWEVSCGLNARSGLDPSLVGWWKLDDGAGSNAVNSAQDAYHGELVGFADTNGGWTEDGYLGGALRFDGLDDWVRIVQVPALLTGGPFTVSTQVWLDLDCTSAWPEAVADYEASTYNGYCLGFNENRAYAMMGPYGWLMDSNALAGRWVWAALEYDGAQMRLYLDGVLAGATSAAFAPATNGFFAIGNGQDDSFGSEFWEGRIDDVRLYRSALGTNGLAGMYDAQEDPDGDGLSNLEECGIGSDIQGSNEVVYVYFVDSTNQAPGGQRSVGGGETAQFVTWNALQAKAASTIRFKEGYTEFTNSTLPPSDPPKWYLGRETLFEAKGDGYFISYDLVDHYIHSASRFCMKEYDPNGWPYSPSTHVCTGEEYFFNSWESYQFWGHMECEYSYEQPNESLLITTNGVSYGLGRIVPILGTGNLNTCEMPMDDELEIYSHTESYRSNNSNRVFWPGTIDPDAYEREWETLTNEYTDGLLLSYTTGDLDGMADWEGLVWGQRWARDEHREAPYAETLPTNELRSIHLMPTNRASLQLQKLRYRWSLASVSGVVYRVFWWEKFIPANGGSGTSVVQRTADVLGTGGTVYTPAFDLPPPTAEGHVYPVPMESAIKVESIRYRRSPTGSFHELSAGTLLLKSQTNEFKAVVASNIGPFPAGAIQWTGTFGTTGEGDTVFQAYNGDASTSDTDFRTVIAGNITVNVVVSDKVLGIHSNADPEGSILQPKHAWISLTDFSSMPAELTTYGLWHTSVNPDQNWRYSPDVDMYVDIEKSWDPGHRRYYLLLPSQYDVLISWLNEDHDFAWGGTIIPPTYDCASFASDTIATVVGEDVDADDILGFETPREVSQSIDALELNDPLAVNNPAEVDGGSSGGSSWLWP